MAAKKRIALSLPAHIDEPISRISAFTGQAKCAIIAEMLEETVPALNAMIEIMDTIKTEQREAAASAVLGVMEEFLNKVSVQEAQARLELTQMKRGKFNVKP